MKRILFAFVLLGILTLSSCTPTPSDGEYTQNPSYPVFLAEFAFLELGARRAAIIGESWSFVGDTNTNSVFKKRFTEMGGKIVFEQTEIKEVKYLFIPTAGDLHNFTNKLLKTNPDVVLLETINQEQSIAEKYLIIQNLKDANFKGRVVFGTDGHALGKYCPTYMSALHLDGSVVDGILYARPVRSPEEVERSPWLEYLATETINHTGYVVLEWSYLEENGTRGCIQSRYNVNR